MLVQFFISDVSVSSKSKREKKMHLNYGILDQSPTGCPEINGHMHNNSQPRQ